MHIITDINVPGPLGRLLAFVGCKVINPKSLDANEREIFLSMPLAPWARAIREYRQAIRELSEKADIAHVAVTGEADIDARVVREAVVQKMLAIWVYHYNFVRIFQSVYPDAMTVVTMPPLLRDALGVRGFRCHRGMSNVAWQTRLIGMRIYGVLACLWNVVRGVRDVVSKSGPKIAPSGGKIGVWFSPGATAHRGDAGGHFSQIDFIRSGRHDVFRDNAAVIVSGQHNGTEFPPVLEAVDLFSVRTAGNKSSFSDLLSLASHSIRTTLKVLFGSWCVQLLAIDFAKMPRARLFVADVRPSYVICDVGMLMGLPLWSALILPYGGKREVFLNSAQVLQHHALQDTEETTALEHYGFICGERIWAWNDPHKKLLAQFGVPSSKIETCGPLMFSEMPERIPDQDRQGPILIDVYDQPPMSDVHAMSIGAPRAFYMQEFSLRFITDVVEIAKAAMAGKDFILRVKTKKRASHVDPVYTAKMQELENDVREVTLVHDRLSPLIMHADADLTIGAPFVSPVNSAKDCRVLSCFYDPLDRHDPNQLGSLGVDVVCGPGQLADWLRRSIEILAQNGRQMPAIGSPDDAWTSVAQAEVVE